jgi:hypothetical protein
MAKNISFILLVLFLLSSCDTSLTQPEMEPDLSASPQITEQVITPTQYATPTFKPTPTLIGQSEFGQIERLIGETRPLYNNGQNPGVFTITNWDLSDPVSFGGDIPGYKFIESVSPDGKWIVFATNCELDCNSICKENNIYIADLESFAIQNLTGTWRPCSSGYYDVNWGIENRNHLIRCKNPDEDEYGLCQITLNENIASISRVETLPIYDLSTSPDQSKAAYRYDKPDVGQCFSLFDYRSQQTSLLLCSGEGVSGYSGLVWLPGSTGFISIEEGQYRIDNSRESRLLLVHTDGIEPEELMKFPGGDEFRMAISSNHKAYRHITQPVEQTKIVFCYKSYPEKLPIFYMYDLEIKESYSIQNTEIIKANQPEYGYYCGSGEFIWDVAGNIYLRTSLGSYLLDFIKGSVSEVDVPQP